MGDFYLSSIPRCAGEGRALAIGGDAASGDGANGSAHAVCELMARSHRPPRRRRADLLWQLLLSLGLCTRLAVSANDQLGCIVAGVGGGVGDGFAPQPRAAGRMLTLASSSASLAPTPALCAQVSDAREF